MTSFFVSGKILDVQKLYCTIRAFTEIYTKSAERLTIKLWHCNIEWLFPSLFMQYGGISIICTSGETQRPGIKRFGLEIEC